MQTYPHTHTETPIVLIVEDDPFIALNLEALLVAHGYDVLGPAGDVDAALAIVSQTEPDAAVLDVNLGRERVTPVAAALSEKGVPFVLATSERTEEQEPVLAEAPYLEKPSDAEQLVETLRQGSW